jgi:hypothetical protein
VPPALAAGFGTGEVWVFREQRSAEMNLDCQLLLLNMGAHKAALQLLKLPFTPHEILPDDLEVRSVVRAVYRLIKAMTSGCSRMQREMVPYLPQIVEHT